MKTKLFGAAAVSILALTHQGAVHAQETAAGESPETRRLGVVTVLAQKREENVQDVPIAINAFSAEDIELRGIQSIEDLTAQVSGLTFGEIAGVGQINLRGIGFGVVSGSGENSVATHYDGVYIANPGASILLQHDIAGIEVLRGPQGTLYGRNATGGVINFTSARPTANFEGGARAGYGNFNALSASGEVSGPLTDKVRARVSVDYIDRGGHVKNLALGGEEGGIERIAGRVSFDVDVTDKLTAQLRLFSVSEDSGAPFYDPIDNTVLNSGISPGQIALDPYEIRTNRHSDSTKELSGGALRFDLDLTDSIRIASISGLADYSFDIKYDGDGTSASVFDLIDRVIEDKTFSQEINILGTTERFTWTLGAYYLDQEVGIDSYTSTPGLNLVGLNSITNQTSEAVKSYALFGDATVNVTDSISVYGGLRHLREEREFVQTQIQEFDVGLFVPPPAIPAPIGVFAPVPICLNLALSNEDNHVTGRVGLKGSFGKTNVYGQYSTGYKSGGYASSTCNDPFEPETLEAFEIGLKSVVLNGSTTFNAAAFHYDYTNLQVEEIVSPNIFVNNADAEVRGIEAELFSAVSDTLTLNAGITLTDAEFTRFSNFDAFNPAAGVQDLSGNPTIRAPKYQITAGAQYTWPLSSSIDMILRADLNASDDYQLREFDAKADAQKAYVTGNISADFVLNDTYTLRGWVKNIADEAILGGVINGGALAPARFGSYGLPRTYGVQVGVKF